MLPYWVLLGFFFLATLFFKGKSLSEKSARRLFGFLAFFILIIMAGLRGYEVGTDTPHYVSFFRSVSNLNSLSDFLESRYELGFVILFKLISLVSTEPAFMIFVTSTIIVCLYGNYIMRSSVDVYISFVLFVLFGFYMNTFNIMRQHIAIGICLNGMLLLKSTKLGKVKSTILFIASVLLASQFHTSALVFFVVLLSPLGKKYPIFVILESMAIIVLFTFKEEITLFLSTWFGYEEYLVSHAQRAGYLDFVSYFILIGFMLLFLSVTQKRNEIFQSIRMEFDVLCVAMIIMVLTLSEYGLIVRLADYFKPMVLVILPVLFKGLRGKDRIIAISMVWVVGVLYYGWTLYVNNGEIVPYMFLFN